MAKKKSNLLFILLVSLVWVSGSNRMAFAQVTSATISGVVKDKTGGVLPGVTIQATNLDTGIAREAITDDEGRYRVTNLPPGNYEVQAELVGFETGVRTGLMLTVGKEAIVDFTLGVGQITERVVVSGEAPLVETTTATVGELVDDQKVRDLPLNKRSFEELVFLQPTISRVPTAQATAFSGSTGKIAAAGSRLESNTFLLDGTDMAHMFWGHTPGSVGGVLMGVETVREFKVVTSNYSAQFGKTSGAVINVVTKSGTNEFHGSVFEFHRNDNVDARNFFDAGDAPEFKRNQFGFTAGGPIVKNRTFFFGSYEALRETLGTTKVAQVPSLLARQGPVAPQIRPFLELFPPPNGRDFGGGIAEFLSNPAQPTDDDYFQIRIDHQFSQSDSIFGRYTFDDASKFVPGDLPNHGTDLKSRNQYLTLQERHIFSPTLLNVFQFGFQRSLPQSFPLTPTFPSGFSINQFVPGGRYPGLLGSVTISGLSPLGAGATDIFRFPDNLFEYSDDLTLSRGRHDIETGAIVKRYQHNWTLDFFFPGQFEFQNLRDFLEARTFFYTGSLPGSDATRHYRETLYGFYVQDNFRARQNLTLNLGLRYEFVGDLSEIDNKFAKIFNPLTDTSTTLGLPVFDKNPSLKNWAPRMGLAWDPSGDGKTAIRAGVGLFYDQILANAWGSGPIFTSPFVNIARIRTPRFPNPFEGVQPTFAFRLQPINFFIEQPHMLKYSLDLQREIFPNAVFRVGYVGARGIQLIRRGDINIPFPQTVDGRLLIPRAVRPNPNFDEIGMYLSDANSFYNALQVTLNKRFSQGFQLQTSYTLSKSVDDASGFQGSHFKTEFANRIYMIHIRTLNRGLSNFDVRQNFNLNYTFDLPFGPGRRLGRDLTGFAGKLAEGWQVSGITSISSGPPFTAIVGRDQSNIFNVNNTRPDLRPGSNNNPVLGGPDRYFDPGAFVLQPQGFIGTAGRDTIIGPGLANFDFTLVKNTAVSSISEDFRIQFRAEFFNLFNRPNFGLPIFRVFNDPTGVPAPNAGRINDTITTSRQVQFGLRVVF
ncbi:MAG: TonB-dependent receptor [Acidobacteria bacterium]|nr:TonB-dependent receptor [Acidobacteriota bacterium]